LGDKWLKFMYINKRHSNLKMKVFQNPQTPHSVPRINHGNKSPKATAKDSLDSQIKISIAQLFLKDFSQATLFLLFLWFQFFEGLYH